MGLIYLASLASNLISSGSLSSSSADSDFPLSNLGTGFTFKPFRFNAAAADDQITADLTTSQAADFFSIHGHNLDNVTSVELRRSTDNFSASDVLVATATPVAGLPAFFKTFTSVSSRYWRVVFKGTNSVPAWIGEWGLGDTTSIGTEQRYGWKVKHFMPQNRVTSVAGQILASNLSNFSTRVLEMRFAASSDANLAEARNIHVNSKWGQEPLIIVPDDTKDIVIHGRVSNSWEYTSDEAQDVLYRYGLSVAEDPMPISVN